MRPGFTLRHILHATRGCAPISTACSRRHAASSAFAHFSVAFVPSPISKAATPNLRGFAERTAVNTPLQGSAADLIKIAMIRIDRRMKEKNLQTWMTLQVHDELLLDVPEHEVDRARQLVEREMENVMKLRVPIVVKAGVGLNWRDIQ